MDQADQQILAQLEKEVPQELTCRMCQKNWRLEQEDLDLFKLLIVPLPTVCPECSMQLKVAFRNERSLYKRKCDATGKEIISIISPDKPYTVYGQKYWFSDAWNPLDYGRDYDFSRGFFEQINELIHAVPYYALYNLNPENSDYINHGADNKNCYLISQAAGNVDCMYGKYYQYCFDCVDCTAVQRCQDCYWNVRGLNNNNCHYLYYSNDCFDCHYSVNLSGCQNCFLCTNLRNKQYCCRNQQLTKEEYQREIAKMDASQLLVEFDQRRQQMIVRPVHVDSCEDCTGDFITNSRKCYYCYAVDDAEYCKYCYDSYNLKDSYDSFSAGLGAELQYNSCTTGKGYRHIASFCDLGSSGTVHCYVCFNCQDCFGCVGLQRQKFCVFNKQYSEAEYWLLVEKIKLQMLERGEYGEFFPPALSPFGYNETIAPDYFPLTKEEALAKGYKWSDYQAEANYNGPWYEPATEVQVYLDETKAKELLGGVLQCAVTGRPFRIVGPELAFYLKHGIPVPQVCPEERYRQRNKLKNPYKLWHRQCMCEESNHEHTGSCPNEFETTYAPERTEKVYCESCYQKSVI